MRCRKGSVRCAHVRPRAPGLFVRIAHATGAVDCASETKAMKQESTPAVQQDSLGIERIAAVFQRTWHVGRRHLRDVVNRRCLRSTLE